MYLDGKLMDVSNIVIHWPLVHCLRMPMLKLKVQGLN